MKPLAITGIGIVSPFALSFASYRDALANPDDAQKRAFEGASSALAADKFPNAITAECRGFDAAAHLGEKGLRNFDRLTKYLIVAGKYALEDAGLKTAGQWTGPLKPEQVGICSSTAYGSLDSITEISGRNTRATV